MSDVQAAPRFEWYAPGLTKACVSLAPSLAQLALPEQPAWNNSAFRSSLETDTTSLSILRSPVTDELTAYALWQWVAPELELLSIAVSPSFRRLGFASLLLKRSFEKLAWESVFLEVRESNMAAQRLYQSLGFVVFDRRHHYYEVQDASSRPSHEPSSQPLYEDAICMQLNRNVATAPSQPANAG